MNDTPKQVNISCDINDATVIDSPVKNDSLSGRTNPFALNDKSTNLIINDSETSVVDGFVTTRPYSATIEDINTSVTNSPEILDCQVLELPDNSVIYYSNVKDLASSSKAIRETIYLMGEHIF